MRVKFISALMSVLIAFPLATAHAASIYVFPVIDCKVTYARAHHNYPATDLLAKAGCKYVAPTSGVINQVSPKDIWSSRTNLGADRGGLSVSMIGDDGVRYYGSHFGKIAPGIAPGVRVSAGDLIAYIGATGSARGTAPHVHFGISWPTPAEASAWWVRRGMLYPWKYLDAWKVGKDLSPVKAIAALKLKVGEVPPPPKK